MNTKKITSLLGATFCLTALTAFNTQAQIPSIMQSDGKDSRTDYILNVSMTPGATNCGPQTQIMNGWTIDAEAFFHHDGLALNTFQTSTGGYFSTQTGTFTAPISGFYHVGASMRIETSAGDITIRHNGTPIAAMGTDLIERLTGNTMDFGGHWSTHSVSRNVYLNVGDSLTLVHESGESNDCVYDTTFKYNHFNVHLIRAVGGAG